MIQQVHGKRSDDGAYACMVRKMMIKKEEISGLREYTMIGIRRPKPKKKIDF